MPFPNLYWWMHLIAAEDMTLDIGEHFEKMSLRNRYTIGAANGVLGLTVPLEKGRDQKSSIKDIKISYREDWQKKHWRSLESAYRRSPFFEFLAFKFQNLFQEKTEKLCEWNMQSIDICRNLLQIKMPLKISEHYIESDGRSLDLRPKSEVALTEWEPYIQPFTHRLPFLQNLSILDALCCLGPQETMAYLRSHIFKIKQSDQSTSKIIPN